MSDYMEKFVVRTKYEELFEMNKWCREIPYIKFPQDVLLQVIPPFCGAVVRFCVSNLEKTKSVSVYLDCYDNLGSVGSPYWELYPYVDGDTYRVAMEDTDELIEKIMESLNSSQDGKVEEEKKITKFYTYSQNNTGGSWIKNEDVCEYVIIEANDYEQANWLAENNCGLYFDGCNQGMDCNCCGDRWTEQWDDNGSEEPQIYGKSAFDAEKSYHRKECIIHYLDGSKVKVEFK